MPRKRFVYGIYDPRFDRLCYVGKSAIGVERWYIHRRQLGRGQHFNRRLQYLHDKLARLGLESLVFRELEVLAPESDLEECEICWIARCREEGVDLFNVSSGGDGTPGRVCSEETRRKISAANKGRKPPDRVLALAVEANRRRIHTVEEKAKRSASMTGKTHGVGNLKEYQDQIRGNRLPESHAEALRQSKVTARAEGRVAHGERCARSKLTTDQVRDIIRMLGEGVTMRELSGQFRVTFQTISHIKNGKTWTRIPR